MVLRQIVEEFDEKRKGFVCVCVVFVCIRNWLVRIGYEDHTFVALLNRPAIAI